MKLSRPAFERLASTASVEGTTFGRWHFVGLYLVKDDYRNRGNIPMVDFNSSEADVYFELDLEDKDLQCTRGHRGPYVNWSRLSSPF